MPLAAGGHPSLSLSPSDGDVSMAKRLVTAFGQTWSVREWSRRSGINEGTLIHRLKSGWPVEQALTQTPRPVDHPFVPRDTPPPPQSDVDPDAWLLQVWEDPRRCGRSFELAFAIHRAVKEGRWPLSVSDLGREANMHRRSLQRLLPALEHCGHLVRSYACQCRVDIILIDKSAPAEPALMAAE